MAVTQEITDSIQPQQPPAAILPDVAQTTAQYTPPNASYTNQSATGVLSSPVTAVNAPLSSNYITDNSLVEKRLENLLSKDNPLLKQAQLNAAQSANSAGVANSSMANQLGTQALLSKGLDIVQQDANLYGQSDLQRQNVENQSLLNVQGADITSKQNAQQTTNQGILNNQQGAIENQAVNQQGAITSALNQQQTGLAMDQTRFNAAISSASEQQKAVIAQQQKDSEMRFNESIQRLNLTEDMKKSVAGLYATASASYITNVAEIMNNPDLNEDAKTALVQKLQENFYAHMETTAALSGVELTFS